MLKEAFYTLFSAYSQDDDFIKSSWQEIANAHQQKGRYYHNLKHLEHLYRCLVLVKKEIQDWEIVLIAIFYHDYVYNILKKDNEKQSAKKAALILDKLSFDKTRIDLCVEMINETKGHSISDNTDINHFTDADLSILGGDWQLYKTFAENVRQEYRFYPDFMYKKGRLNMLNHFLMMPRIFKTHYFFNQFETKARENLQREIELLSK